MDANPSEKRCFLRHPIHAPIQLEADRGQIPVLLECSDLSLGGLSFLWKQRLRKGGPVHITIPVKEKLFKISARVVYSKEDRKTGRFRTGVSFSDATSAFKAKLAEESLEILEYRKEVSRKSGREISEEEAACEWIKEYAKQFPKISYNA